MSKVPYTVNVEEYVCSVLEEMRKMCKTLDFTALPARIENIQHHASKMEEAIHATFKRKYSVKSLCEDESVTDAEFREKVKEIMKGEDD